MRNLKELKGVKLITKNEQKSINGGGICPCVAGGFISNPPWCDIVFNGVCWICR